jgi:hypothetical protein
MATAVQQAGLMAVYVATGGTAYSSMELLGYTRNGVESTKDGFHLDVHGDENGGDDGPPIEVQYLGEIVRVRLELTKYDAAVAAKITPRVAGGTAGTPSTAGTLLFAGTKTYRVVLYNAAGSRNYPRCIMRAPIEINRGTKFSTLIVEFEAHKNSTGILYDTSTTTSAA